MLAVNSLKNAILQPVALTRCKREFCKESQEIGQPRNDANVFRIAQGARAIGQSGQPWSASRFWYSFALCTREHAGERRGAGPLSHRRSSEWRGMAPRSPKDGTTGRATAAESGRAVASPPVPEPVPLGGNVVPPSSVAIVKILTLAARVPVAVAESRGARGSRGATILVRISNVRDRLSNFRARNLACRGRRSRRRQKVRSAPFASFRGFHDTPSWSPSLPRPVAAFHCEKKFRTFAAPC